MIPVSTGTENDGETPLVASLRAGEPAACERLVREHGPKLLATARRLLGDEQDAQDAVQDAFINAFRGIGTFEGTSRLGTWLHAIVVRSALMKLRSRRRHPEQSIEPLLPRFLSDGHAAHPAASWDQNVVSEVGRRDMRDFVRRKIDRLPEDFRTVLLLRDIEQMDTAETARVLGIEPGAVKTRLHRARQALRGLLDGEFRGGEVLE